MDYPTDYYHNSIILLKILTNQIKDPNKLSNWCYAIYCKELLNPTFNDIAKLAASKFYAKKCNLKKEAALAYIIKLGYCGATDCMLRIYYGENYKEFEIESLKWKLISLYWNVLKGKMKNNGYTNKNQKLLKTIYNN